MREPLHYETLAGYYSKAAGEAVTISRALAERNDARVDKDICQRRFDEVMTNYRAQRDVDVDLSEISVIFSAVGQAALDLQAAIKRFGHTTSYLELCRAALADTQTLIADWYKGEAAQ